MNSPIAQLDLPNGIVPVQYFPVRGYAPAQRLMWAMLDTAVNDIDLSKRTPTKRAVRLATMAMEWIFQEDLVYSHSFLNICHFLDLDPYYLRKGLAEKYAL